jgi:hypothetical protein
MRETPDDPTPLLLLASNSVAERVTEAKGGAMTRTFSFMAVIVAALAVSVPAAFGDDWGADRQTQTSLAGMPDVVDRALVQRQQELGASFDARLDAREQALVEKRNVQLSTGTPPDLVERVAAAAAKESGSGDHFVANDNRFSIDPMTQPVPVSVTGPGDDLEWAQIGIGLGAGILLAFGLVLGLRLIYVRPLAH